MTGALTRGNPGLRLVAAPAAAQPELAELFRGVPTSQIGDAMHRMNGTTGLRRFHGAAQLLGFAHTVRVRAGDNLLIYKALETIRPGEVLVVDGEGDCARALVGEIIKELAKARGAAGLVIDGALRDVTALAADDFPCYARGVSLKGPYKNGPGEVGVTASIGGMVVAPGDILVGDADGIVAFSPTDARRLAIAVAEIARAEERMLASIQSGTYDFGWVEHAMVKAGLPT